MKDSYRTGIIGFAHMHINQLAGVFSRHPRSDLGGLRGYHPAAP